MNITCVLLYLSRALYIFECINLSVQDLFLGELLHAMISFGPRLRSWSFRFCVSILLLASYPCIVSPHRRSHKPRQISTLKTKNHPSWLPPWPQPIIEDGSPIQERLQDGATIEDFKYLSKGKVFPVPTLSLSPLCPRTSKRLSMGEEVGTMQF
jgi:hypothetical protein